MENLAFSLWLGSGIFLMAIEFLIPGLVMVFVGLGAFDCGARHAPWIY